MQKIQLQNLLRSSLLLVFFSTSCSTYQPGIINRSGGETYEVHIVTNPLGASFSVDGETEANTPHTIVFTAPVYYHTEMQHWACTKHNFTAYEGTVNYNEFLSKNRVLEIKKEGYKDVVITFNLLNARNRIPDVITLVPTRTETTSKHDQQQQMQQQMMGPTIVIGGQTVTGERAIKIKEFGVLNFESVPEGAEIYIENNLIGNTPLSQLKFEKGTYNVTAKMRGYNDWKRQIIVIENSTVTIKAELDRTQ